MSIMTAQSFSVGLSTILFIASLSFGSISSALFVLPVAYIDFNKKVLFALIYALTFLLAASQSFGKYYISQLEESWKAYFFLVSGILFILLFLLVMVDDFHERYQDDINQ